MHEPNGNPSHPARRITLAIAAAAFVFGIGVRVFYLFAAGDLSMAEVLSWDLARRGPLEMLDRLSVPSHTNATVRYHGGLTYHLVLKVWTVFGQSELALRSLSLVAGLGVLGWLGWWTRRLDATAAALLVAIAATSPFLVQWSVPARPYALYLLLCVVSTTSLLAMLRQRRWVWAYVGSTALLLHTHHWGLLLVAAQTTAFVVWWAGRLVRPTPWKPWLASQAVLAVSLVPVWSMLQIQAETRGFVGEISLQPAVLSTWIAECGYVYGRVLQHFDASNLIGHQALDIAMSTTQAALYLAGGIALFRRSRVLGVLALCMLTVPVLLYALISALHDVRVESIRYFLFMAPVGFGLWALAVQDLGRLRPPLGPYLRPALLGLVVIMGAWLTLNALRWDTPSKYQDLGASQRDTVRGYEPWRMATDWRGLAAYVAEESRGDRVFLVEIGKQSQYLRYYLPGERAIGLFPARYRNPKKHLAQHLQAMGLLFEEVWYLRMRPSLHPVIESGEVRKRFRVCSGASFGTVDVQQWSENVLGGRTGTVGFSPFFDATPGQTYSLDQYLTSPDRRILYVIARSTDEPPFACEMDLTVNGANVARKVIGASYASVFRFDPRLTTGPNSIVISFLPFSGDLQPDNLERYQGKGAPR